MKWSAHILCVAMHTPSLQLACARDHAAGAPAKRLGVLVALAGCLFAWGCTLGYVKPGTGEAHLWGFGAMRLVTNSISPGLMSITKGIAVPGLYLGVGQSNFGISLGYSTRQTLIVANAPIDAIYLPTNSFGLRLNGTGTGEEVWGLGHLRMQSMPDRSPRQFVVSANAVAGLSLGIGKDESGVSLGLANRSVYRAEGTNTHLSFLGTNGVWPSFDLFNAKVAPLVLPEESSPNSNPK